jgi:hypothetical protein
MNKRLLYLSPIGSDSWTGKLPEPSADGLDGPLCTLDGARRAVRTLRAERQTGDIVVVVRGGEYPVNETVVFGLKDSGEADQRISYQAAPGEFPIFSAGVPVTGWQPLRTPLSGLPGAAVGKIWVADIPDGVSWFGMLYDAGIPQPRARGKGFTPTVSGYWEDEECWRLGSRTCLHFPKGAMRAYENVRDAEIVIRPWCLWTMNILPLASVDEDACVATTAIEGSYFLSRERYHRFPEESVWVENIPEGMTGPGRWMMDSISRKIYLWPEGDHPSDDITVPCLREIVRIEGDIRVNEPEDVPVRYLGFKGLGFVQGDRDRWTAAHKGVQHDWEMWDEGNALLRLRGAEECEVLDCTFGPSGGAGIRLDLHAVHNRIEGCHLHDLGGTGIFLGGYGAGVKNVNGRNQIVSNHVHDCGQQFWHAAGILVHQSGENRIAHNLLYNLPYSGIVMAGIRPGFLRSQVRDAVLNNTPDFDRSFIPIKENMRTQSLREICTQVRWAEVPVLDGMDFTDEMTLSLPFIHSRQNVVEYNEIHDIMQVLGDGNGIYISDCGPYNVIRYNRIYNMTHAFGVGIRTDECQRDTLVESNVIHDCRGGLAISANNLAWNNVIAFIRSTGKGGAAQGEGDQEVFIPIYYHLDRARGFSDGTLQRNICYHEGDEPMRFNLERVSSDPGTPKQMVDFNIIHWAARDAAAMQLLGDLQVHGFDAHSRTADPGFVDAQARDFRLRPDAPAKKLGIRSIPQERIGLLSGKDIVKPFIKQWSPRRDVGNDIVNLWKNKSVYVVRVRETEHSES